jgi:amidase
MATTSNGSTWEQVAASMQEHRANTIAAVEPLVPDIPTNLPLNVTGIPQSLLPDSTLTITQLSTEELLPRLASGELASTQVVNAFLQRAGLASKLVNCCTELLPERALERAAYLDDYLKQHGKPIGPLHGLPISVKEHVGMKGLDLNAGFVSWVGRKAPDDATLLKFLWKAGCVFYARTTQPQTLMHLECSNNIYGVTVNPYNSRLTSGGSSGGEGALLGMKGSCLGIGSDIGGSIRSPSANNGIFGLRPSSFRLPFLGWMATMLGEEQVIPVIGPMSTTLEGVKIFMKTVIDQKPWKVDGSLLPLPWKTEPLIRKGGDGKQKLRVGILADDGVVKPHPPILRGINTIIEKLKSNPDIETVTFPPYKHDEAWRIIASLYFGDGAQEEKEALAASGEPWRPMTKHIISDNPFVKELTVPEVWDLTIQREGYRAAYVRHWNSVGTSVKGPDDKQSSTFPEPLVDSVEEEMVDVILCPVGPGCAPQLDTAKYWGYTAQWNLLDYPALVFPTGLQCSDVDGIERDYEPRNEKDKYNYDLCEFDQLPYQSLLRQADCL